MGDGHGDGPAWWRMRRCVATAHIQVERNTTTQQPDKQPRLRPSSSSFFFSFPPSFHTLSPSFFLLLLPSFFFSLAPLFSSPRHEKNATFSIP